MRKYRTTRKTEACIVQRCLDIPSECCTIDVSVRTKKSLTAWFFRSTILLSPRGWDLFVVRHYFAPSVGRG